MGTEGHWRPFTVPDTHVELFRENGEPGVALMLSFVFSSYLK